MMEQAQSAMRKLMSERFWLSLYVKADMEQMSRIADEVLKTLQEFREKEGRKVSIATVLGALRICEVAIIMAGEEVEE